MTDIDICKNVITIPQADNTNVCWFNSIIMAMLYSHNSRNLLLSNNKLEGKRDKISKILNQILKRQFMQNKYYEEYFKYMRTEKILKYLNFFTNKESYDLVLQRGYNSALAIHKFINKLGKTSLNLNIYRGKIYGNLNLFLDNIDIFATTQDSSKIEREILQTIETINEDMFKNCPDYIIVNTIDDNARSFYNGLFIETVKFLSGRNLVHKLLLNTYDNIQTVGISTLEDRIFYNGETYILDSCILGNFNIIGNIGHAISGITCNDNKYVYNGTFRHKGSLSNPRIDNKRSPCDLMKFDWNVREENKFCLNPIYCKLDISPETPSNKLCFSFDKGSRVLIYVKASNIRKPLLEIYKNTSEMLSSLEMPSTSSLSNEEMKINMKKFINDLKTQIGQIERETKRRKI
jgi:hypothetical protein